MDDLICLRRSQVTRGETLCGRAIDPLKGPLTQWLEYFKLTSRMSTRHRYCETCFTKATNPVVIKS